MTRARRTARRNGAGWLLAMLALLIPAGLGGCRASVGGRDLFFRVAREVPPMVQENGDGRRVELPAIKPEGDAVFFFVRGRL